MLIEWRRVADRAAIVLAMCGTMLLDGTRLADAANSSLCLTPAAEHALKDLLAADTFRVTLGRDLTLKGLSLSGDKIELRAEDARGHESAIVLSLSSGSISRPPDGQGQRFVFHLVPADKAPSADSGKALLAVADLIDRTVPDAAFADCSGPPSAPEPRQSPVRSGFPLSLALISAAAQILILAGATVFGWRTIRSTAYPAPGDACVAPTNRSAQSP